MSQKSKVLLTPPPPPTPTRPPPPLPHLAGGILNSVESALSIVPIDISFELPTLEQLRNVSELRFCGYENCRPVDLCQQSAEQCGAQASSNFEIGSEGGRPLTCCEGSPEEFRKRLCLAMFNDEACDRFSVSGGFSCRRRRRRLGSFLLSSSRAMMVNPSTATFVVSGPLSDLNEAEE